MRLARLREIYRSFSERCSSVLSMNGRNLEYIYPSNDRRHFQLADNKLRTKELLECCALPSPKSYCVFSYFYELASLASHISGLDAFVIKPAQGSGGNGILVLERIGETLWQTPGGTRYDLDAIKKQIVDILFGIYSFGMNDQAIIEEKIVQHPRIDRISPLGLADLRIIVYKEQTVMAMMRVATSESGGRANLHQGGIGIAIDMEKGVTTRAMRSRELLSHHPDNGEPLTGVSIPYWDEILQIARQTAQNVPLAYLGIDIAMGEKTPVILEFNVRPGIEIQNIAGFGLEPLLQQAEARSMA